MATHRDSGGALKRAGVDITANVNCRMVSPEARATAAKGGPALDDIGKEIASRLPVGLRDEAIWQYHLCGRGFVLWCAGHSLRYIRGAELNRNGLDPRLRAADAIPEALNSYDPAWEALILLEYPDEIEAVWIDANEEFTLLWSEPLCLSSGNEVQNQNALSRAK
jgi:hypothetical protein